MTRQMRSMTRLIWIAALLLLTVIAPATAAPSATAEGERGMVVSAQHEASERDITIPGAHRPRESDSRP